MSKILELLDNNPVISAIKGLEELDEVIKSDNEIVFILTSNLSLLKDLVEKLKEANKVVFVHIDLVEGLSSSTYAIDYIIENIEIDGIISTKNSLVKYAKKKNIMVIQRFFLLDSLSLRNCLKNARENRPSAIEILPGLMPKIIKKLSREINVPIIAGGLIEDKEDIMEALKAGAQGVSTTKKEMWDI